MDDLEKKHISIHWFRHGLRLHDNPALNRALSNSKELYFVFIFDGEVAGTKLAGYNRWRFLHESLQDVDQQLKKLGSRLCCFRGKPTTVLGQLFQEWSVTQLSFEQDPEPVWRERDDAVKQLCKTNSVEVVESVSHTLWDPKKILESNGGMPPLTLKHFEIIIEMLGSPHRPVKTPVFDSVSLPLPDNYEDKFALPTLEDLGVKPEFPEQLTRRNEWIGGESRALELFMLRKNIEKEAFMDGLVLPNQFKPDLLGPPTSLAPYLRFGCLSPRVFYWGITKAYLEVKDGAEAPKAILTQLIWREYFYTMSVNNVNYAQMEGNPICLQIDWYRDQDLLTKWEMGQTGYPWIDACMNQLRQEGWLHHVGRNAVACFLTRGDLWIHWEDGLKVFFKYLLDADWSVCAGNWMWVSSSAFEDCLQCPICFSPTTYGMKMDPSGEYIKRYVPALRHMPLKYIFCPWKAPLEVQQQAGCIVGQDYPEPIVDHKEAWRECKDHMLKIKSKLKNPDVLHIKPSDIMEVRKFFLLPATSAMRCTANEACHAISAQA